MVRMDNMMNKVTIIIGSLGKGGAERVTIYLAKLFKESGWECDILTLSKDVVEYQLPSGINRLIASEKKENIVNQVKNLRDKLKISSPNIVLIMGVPLCSYVVPALSGLGIPFVVSERTSPAHFSGNPLNIIIARKLMKKANGYIFQTHDAKAFYQKKIKDRGVVIENPLETKKLPPVCSKKTREDTIVSVGRLIPSKNFANLIGAFAELQKIHPHYKLIIFGEGYLRQDLEQLVDRLQLREKVMLPGRIDNVVEEIQNKAMFVMTSNYEGMPNALIEAMAMGLPCISTDCPAGGVADLIENEVNGLLIDVDDVSATCRAMKKLIENPILAQSCADNAIKVREKLGGDVIGPKWIRYFEEVLHAYNQ